MGENKKGYGLSHLYQDVSAPVVSSTDLMQPQLNSGDQLAPTNIDRKILSAIGWNVTPPVALDDVEINAANCTSAPNQVINLGVTNVYCQGGSALVDPGGAHWELILFAEDNAYVVATQNTGSFWSLNLTRLPAGRTWSRDINGRIPGILSYQNGIYRTWIGVGVNYKPQYIEFNAHNASQFWCECDKEELQFFAPGATSYRILRRDLTVLGSWGSWSVITTAPTGTSTYTFTGLSEYKSYQFQVEAVNANGSIMSRIITRGRCKNTMQVFPNPAIELLNLNLIEVKVDKEDEGLLNGFGSHIGADFRYTEVAPHRADPCGDPDFNIVNVSLVSVRDARISSSFPTEGNSGTVKIDVSSLKKGLYTITATSRTGEKISTLFQKL